MSTSTSPATAASTPRSELARTGPDAAQGPRLRPSRRGSDLRRHQGGVRQHHQLAGAAAAGDPPDPRAQHLQPGRGHRQAGFRRRDPGHRRRAEAEPVPWRRDHQPVAHSAAQLASWAPTITPSDPTGLTIEPTVRRPATTPMPARSAAAIHLHLSGPMTAAAAFGFVRRRDATIRVDATLSPRAARSNPLTDRAWIQLVKSANPFMPRPRQRQHRLRGSALTCGCSRSSPAGIPSSASRLVPTRPRAQALDFLRNAVSTR